MRAERAAESGVFQKFVQISFFSREPRGGDFLLKFFQRLRSLFHGYLNTKLHIISSTAREAENKKSAETIAEDVWTVLIQVHVTINYDFHLVLMIDVCPW